MAARVPDRHSEYYRRTGHPKTAEKMEREMGQAHEADRQNQRAQNAWKEADEAARRARAAMDQPSFDREFDRASRKFEKAEAADRDRDVAHIQLDKCSREVARARSRAHLQDQAKEAGHALKAGATAAREGASDGSTIGGVIGFLTPFPGGTAGGVATGRLVGGVVGLRKAPAMYRAGRDERDAEKEQAKAEAAAMYPPPSPEPKE